MSVTLISPPGEISFSADFINAEFQCDDYVQTAGVRSVNGIFISSNTDSVVIQYADNIVMMTGAVNPDNSGTQFPGTAGTTATDALPFFKLNPILAADFDITVGANSTLLFTAKKDGPNYDFQGYNSTPGTDARLKPNYSVYVKLLVQNATDAGYSEAYSANISLTNGTNKATAILGDKLHQRLTADIYKLGPEIPGENGMACKVSCRKYFFQYGESSGAIPVISGLKNTPVYTVIHGGLSYRAKGRETVLSLLQPGAIKEDRFLTQSPNPSSTRIDQPQYLYFLNTRALINATINCKFEFTDGSFATIPLETYSLAKGAKFGFKLRFDEIFKPDDYPVKKVRRYFIWLSDPNGSAISETRTFVLDYSYKQQFRYFLSWSSWGALECRMFYGKGSVEFDLVQSVAERNSSLPSGISQGNSVVFNSSIQSKFSITTGFIENKKHLLFNREFFIATIKYVFSRGNLLPIRITSKTIGEIEDGNNLFAQKFEYQYLFDDQAYTEGDIDLPLPPPERKPGQVYFGPSALRPRTEEDVFALPNSQSPEIYLMPLYTGMSKFMNVALPWGKSLGNAFDNTSQEDVTSEYQKKPFIVDNEQYNVYTMEMAVAYTLNHDHIITIIND